MANRRFWLVLGGAGLVVSAACPAEAGTAAEVEGGVHGGTASGAWACGPSARVKYAGLGARGRVWVGQKAPEIPGGNAVPEGFSVGAGVAGESRSYSLLQCNNGVCNSDQDRKVPPSGLVGAAALSGGYDGKNWGIRAGALVLQRYRDNSDTKPTLQAWPDVALRIGQLRGLRLDLGLGAYSTDTMLHPGVYVGGLMPVSERVELGLRLGVHQNFDADSGVRGDFSARFKLGEATSLQVAGGASEGASRANPHGRLLFGAEFLARARGQLRPRACAVAWPATRAKRGSARARGGFFSGGRSLTVRKMFSKGTVGAARSLVWAGVFLVGACLPQAQRPAGQARSPAQAPGEKKQSGNDCKISGLPSPMIGPRDPSWGSPEAPVVLVLFDDLDHTFGRRVEVTLARVRALFGPDKLRVIWKNNPMPFHAAARPAAAVGQAIFEQRGHDAFWKYRGLILAAIPADDPDPDDLAPGDILRAAAAVGLDEAAVKAAQANPSMLAKIDEDIALAKALGISGAPAAIINGREVVGARELEAFQEVIEAELARAQRSPATPGKTCDLLALGLGERQVPDTPKAKKSDEKPVDSTTVWKIPVGTSASRGPTTALVTIVEFGGFQDRFTRRVEPTLRKLRETYGDKVRIVWKDYPLAFHLLSEPAAHLGREALAKHGVSGFWALHDRLLEQKLRQQSQLDDAAITLGFDLPAAQGAMKGKKYETEILEDLFLGDDFSATGTPHFFINGRRLVGAQSFESFQKIVDEEISRAEALLARGTKPASIYEALIAQGKPPEPPKMLVVSPPSKQAPSRGASQAKVVIQQFANFQDPFTKRVEPTLLELQNIYKNKVRLVWRHRPLPFHKDAPLASEAALEAMAQQGPDAFWRMHDLLLVHQADEGGLKLPALEGYARQLGLDLPRFLNALQNHIHAPTIAADLEAAEQSGINGTPNFVINGYQVSGAQPLRAFRRIIDRALAE